MSEPIICFGQQPNGFLPKRYVIAKVLTARKMQKELGGKIVWFYHDSDSDYRETITIVKDREGREERLNYLQENKIQKKFSPLYLKRIPSGWQEEMGRRMHRFVDKEIEELFRSIQAANVADFCLEMYQGMGMLDGIEIVRSSDVAIREKAMDLTDNYFADVSYEGEIVRAKYEMLTPDPKGLGEPFGSSTGRLTLHEGGGQFITLPEQSLEKKQKNPSRDNRLLWMQSVVHCTYYIYGAGEAAYMDFTQTPEVLFTQREEIERAEESWISKFPSL